MRNSSVSRPACSADTLRSRSLPPPRPARVGPRGALLALVVSGLLTAALLAGATGASAAEAGVNILEPGSSQIAAVQALGVHWVRMFISWRDMEPQRGALSSEELAGFEGAFRALPRGTKLILDVVDSPEWETGSPNEHSPPANPADYAKFVSALAKRWGSLVSAYEIWNEEDSSAWWASGPNAAEYAGLLKATYPAIKAADPKATVVLGGLVGNDYPFLEGVYAAGGKGYFDAVGVHTDTACNIASPYEFVRGAGDRLIPDSFLAYREVHAVMLAHGDDKPIWMTEMSWPTTSALCAEGAFAGQKAGGVSEETQASDLREAYHCLAMAPYVQVSLWFSLQDEGGSVRGLERADGSRKPSFAAMQAYAREGDTLTGACGDFTGPTITVSSPHNGMHYSGPLPIRVSATDPDGVWRIRLELDGKLIRNYDSGSYPTTLTGAIDYQHAKHVSYGWHVLTVTAYDKENNESSVSVRIFHAGGSAVPNAKKHKKRRKKRKRR